MSNEETSNLDGAVQELILAQSWEEATELLKRYPTLVSSYGEEALESSLSIQADTNAKAAIGQRLQLLRYARNIGAEAASRLVASIDPIITVEVSHTFHEIVGPFLRSGTTDEICQVLKRFPELASTLPRTEIMPTMQAFRCDVCRETLIWKGAVPSRRSGPNATFPPRGGWMTSYVVVSFRRVGSDLIPGPAVECPDAALAIQRAGLMTRETEIAGSVAFSRARQSGY